MTGIGHRCMVAVTISCSPDFVADLEVLASLREARGSAMPTDRNRIWASGQSSSPENRQVRPRPGSVGKCPETTRRPGALRSHITPDLGDAEVHPAEAEVTAGRRADPERRLR